MSQPCPMHGGSPRHLTFDNAVQSPPNPQSATAQPGGQACDSDSPDSTGHLHNHVGLTENFDQSENEEFLVNDSP